MKTLKFLLVLAVMFVVASCDSGQNPNNLPVMAKALKVQDTIAVNAGPYLDIKMYTVIIDGCQYIMGDDDGPYNGGYFLTHRSEERRVGKECRL